MTVTAHDKPSWRNTQTRGSSKSPTHARSRVDYIVTLPRPHSKQAELIASAAKRKIIRGGRRGGKTVGAAILAVKCFLGGQRVLYSAPTNEQVEAFWFEVRRTLAPLIDGGVLEKNETLHIVEVPDSRQRIRAKTSWNADTLRGDYADLLILDEWQLMNEDAWELVGAPMLLDNDGDAVFIYTPPSLRSRSVSKARDPRHAAKLFKRAQEDKSGRWLALSFSSHENPHISKTALAKLTEDMTALAIRQEIMAEDIDDAPGALWTRAMLDNNRLRTEPQLVRVVVAIDPPADHKAQGSGAGIMVGGVDADGHGYLLADGSLDNAKPSEWGGRAVSLFEEFAADRIIGEVNNGGEMIEHVIRSIRPSISYRAVRASRGKATRAEPIAAHYEQGRVHHVGDFPILEDELCLWTPGDSSPHRLDALVWLFTELMVDPEPADTIMVYDGHRQISPY